MPNEYFVFLRRIYTAEDMRLKRSSFSDAPAGMILDDLRHKHWIRISVLDGQEYVEFTHEGRERFLSEQDVRNDLAEKDAERKQEQLQKKAENRRSLWQYWLTFIVGFVLGMMTDRMKEAVIAWFLSLFH